MKKILFSLSLMLVGALSISAQSASCCSKKASAVCKKSDNTKVASVILEADEMAAKDESIQRRVCRKSGAISYFKKEEIDEREKWVEVTFDQEKKEFTRVASMVLDKTESATAQKKCAKGKACCKKKEG